MMAVVAEVDRGPGADVAGAASPFDRVAAIVHREVNRHGGVIISRVASVSWVVFGDSDDAASWAVDAGLAIRDALTTARSVRDAEDGEAPQPGVKVAIVSTNTMRSCHPG